MRWGLFWLYGLCAALGTIIAWDRGRSGFAAVASFGPQFGLAGTSSSSFQDLLDQERSPGLHDPAPTLQYVTARVALLDLTPHGMGQGLFRPLSAEPRWNGDVPPSAPSLGPLDR